jgi:hypothetical protein
MEYIIIDHNNNNKSYYAFGEEDLKGWVNELTNIRNFEGLSVYKVDSKIDIKHLLK